MFSVFTLFDPFEDPGQVLERTSDWNMLQYVPSFKFFPHSLESPRYSPGPCEVFDIYQHFVVFIPTLVSY